VNAIGSNESFAEEENYDKRDSRDKGDQEGIF
jgi:hypothetical protein